MEDATKDRILEVATKLFSAQGLKNTKIRQIADRAKANSALIFYYFGCKEKLFYACISEMASERLKISQEILRDPQDFRDFELKLGFFARGILEVQGSKKDLLKILHRELDNNNKKAKKIFEDQFSQVAKTLSAFFFKCSKKRNHRQINTSRIFDTRFL
jgi:AcrR family transcriptional regulator